MAYAKQVGLDLYKPTRYDGTDLPSLWQIAEDCVNKALALPIIPSVVHGDLCF